MSDYSLTYHSGQKSLERNTFFTIKKVKRLLQDRKAIIVPARYGRRGIYISEENAIVIIDKFWKKIITFSPPADFYQHLLEKAREIVGRPFRVQEYKDKKIFYSNEGMAVFTTKSGKTITKIELSKAG